jgi:O-antigen/teichoic acid export membrane protein
VLGLVLADALVTTVFTMVLVRWFVPLIRPTFSATILRDALRFGLPRVPHSLASQVIGLADRYFLNALGSLSQVGLYSIGASFGLALKLFLSAFEAAWTPFFLGAMREPDARTVYKIAATYVLGVLVLLVAGLGVVAADLVRIFTTEEFHRAAEVTPWIAVGVLFQGVYLVGSIGLVITKRTAFYPVATGTAALASIVANLLLIPRFGYLGAAWANALSYATLAGLTVTFSQRVYPIDYEWSRLARIAGAGALAFAAGTSLPGESWGPWTSLLARGAVTTLSYLGVLAATRFFHAGELGALAALQRRLTAQRPRPMHGPESVQVEMAGEIAAGGPEPADSRLDAADETPASRTVNEDSRSQHR